MITIVHEPKILQTSQNPIYYQFHTDNADARYIVAEVWVEIELYADDYELIDTLSVAPDKNREGKIYIQEVLDALLEYELPPVFEANSIYFLKKTVKRYFLKIAEFTTELGEFMDLSPKFSIKAAFQFTDYATRGSSVVPADRYWLTTQSYTREMANNQYEFLYFLPPATQTANLTISQIDESGGVIVTETIPVAMRQYEPFALPCGANHRFYNPDAQKIRVSLFQTVEFLLKNRKHEPYFRSFFYFNSLGGLDSFVTIGETQTQIEAEKTVFQTYTPDEPLTSDGEFRTLKPYLRKRVKLATGYKRKKEIEALADMINSTQAYEYINNRLVPILISSKKYDVQIDGEFLNAAELEYEYAFFENAIKPQF